MSTKNAEKRGVGRPTKYRPEHIAVARQVAALGGLDFHIAKALEVDVQSIENWQARYPEFRAACEPSEEDMIRAMRRSLYHRGMGYSHQAVKILSTSKGVEEVPYVEHYPPDVTAIKYFLNNRDRKNWTERQEVETHGDVTVRIEGGLPDDEEMS